MNEKDENLVKISRALQKKFDIDSVVTVFKMMEDKKYSEWNLPDFRDFLIKLIER